MATTDGTAYVDHPLLTENLIERRLYQLRLAGSAIEDHTLVCLPTGLGKTTVSLLVTARRLDEVGGKSLLLAPTKPLVEQHATFYREALSVDDEEIVVFTGEVRPDDRAALWDDATIVIATPQVVENDLIGGRISLSDVTHCTFDECHRATGDYAYTYIAERYHGDATQPLVTGMSASPGGDREEIRTICENLGLRSVEVMTEEDADVDEFTHGTDVEWETVELPDEIREIRDALSDVIEDRLGRLRDLGVTRKTSPDLSQKDLNRLRGKLQELIDADESAGYQGMSVHAEIMKLRRAVELVETQSVESLRRYFERQRQAARSSGASKASQRFVSDPAVKKAMRLAREYDGRHPKFSRVRIKLAETLGIENGERVIVFTESRDTAEVLTEFLGEHFDTRRFVGQGDKDGSDGMTQKEQAEVLDAFRAGEFEVLVSTSVAEEGLDVPEVDLVCFYEPVPTAIRSIQRKGRTGRQAKGAVIVLMAEDTRDEAYFWIARRREQEMESELRDLKAMSGQLDAELAQSNLEAFERTDSEGEPKTGGPDDGSETPGDPDNGSESRSRDDDRETRDSDDEKETEAPDSVDDRTDDGATREGGRRESTDNPENGGDDQPGLDAFVPNQSEPPDERKGETNEADDRDEDETAEGEVDATTEDDTRAPTDIGTADGEAVIAPEGDGVEIVIDQRELDSNIARELSTRDGIETRLQTLAVGDYVCSDRVAIERKTVEDFLDTLLGEDRSLFEQAGDLVRHYPRSVVVLEGDRLYERRNVHPNAIRGALTSLAVDFGISVLHSADEDETVELLATIAKREQGDRDRTVSVHGEKQSKTLAEQQEYVVASIAEIGPVTARSLLASLGSVEAVMTAAREELLGVDGVGEVTADRIREVVGSAYNG